MGRFNRLPGFPRFSGAGSVEIGSYNGVGQIIGYVDFACAGIQGNAVG